jgi:RNA polymerase sigma-70 factor (ECF subfamily)
MDDPVLITRCRQGDELAWEALVVRYQARVCALAFGYTGSEEEALDVAQEVFVRIWRRLDSCRDPDRLTAWILSITRHAALDHLRRRQARPPAQDVPADALGHLADPRAEATDAPLEQQEQRDLLDRALQELTPRNREAILLKDIQELSLEDMARMLEVPVGTVKSRCSRARVELAKVLGRMLGADPDTGVAS